MAANTNCHLSALMQDRVQRKKYGLECNKPISNYDFMYSYLNRLNCKSIDMSCYGDKWKPCKQTRIEILCNIDIIINTSINQQTGEYTFTVTVNNSVGNLTYTWTIDGNVWSDFTQSDNTLTVTADLNVETTTDVTVLVEDDLGCTVQETIEVTYKPGCTDETAINYDPNATHEFVPSTCYYIPLTLTSTYTCNESNEGVVSHTITGGIPPYTIIGTPNGAIIPNGDNYLAYVVDSIGNISNSQGQVIACPFDCGTVTVLANASYTCIEDENGLNTGQATLSILPSGGTPPYSISGGSDGQIVNDGDVLNIQATDANGCVSAIENITIDCPVEIPPPGLTCEDVSFDWDVTLRAYTDGNNETLGIGIHSNLTNLLPAGVVLTEVNLIGITDNSGVSTINCGAFSGTHPTCTCVSCFDPSCANCPTTQAFELDYGVGQTYSGKEYNLRVQLEIKFQINTGGEICTFNYDQTFSGTWGTYGVGTGNFIQKITQNF